MTLEIITAEALSPLRHGFFTRRGGASSGVFRGLNCGLGSTDQADAVALNRRRVADAMGVGPGALRPMHQIHSARVAVAAHTDGRPPEVDGMVTATSGIALTVLTADCAPTLFADVEAGVIGVAHAGWRGAVSGILEATIEAMEDLGADRADIAAVIGPAISQSAYEVGPDLMDAVTATDPDAAQFFVEGDGDRQHFDLPHYCLWRLDRAGLGHAEWLNHCTYSSPEMFFSYRRSVHQKQADYGRLISAIRL